MEDPYDLERFVSAQSECFAAVLSELGAGHKRTHWMWFVFPQLRGLGSSARSEHFGIRSTDEARAYWGHPVLGDRLRRCVGLVLAVDGRSARQIFGSPDDLKFCSCMTLFATAVPEESSFPVALDRYFAGDMDRRTLEMLRGR